MQQRTTQAQAAAKQQFDDDIRAQAKPSAADELVKLTELKEKGVLSADEFERAKTAALAWRRSDMTIVEQSTHDALTSLSTGDLAFLENDALRLRPAAGQLPGCAVRRPRAQLALDAPPASYAWQVANALEDGASPADILGVLRAVALPSGRTTPGGRRARADARARVGAPRGSRVAVPIVRRRPLLRAAAVGGGADAMGRHNAQGQQREADQEARLQQLEAEQASAPPAAPAPAPAPAAGLTDAAVAQLQQLGQLHEQGVLTDAEFVAQKARLLGT